MKTERDDIDRLLEQNASEQLVDVDWIKLNSAISTRIDLAGQHKAIPVVGLWVFRIAAGLVTAATILIVIFVGTDRTPDFQLENGTLAAVEFTESKGSASVKIGYASAQSQVMIDVGSGQSRLAMCEVRIIDTNGEHNTEGSNTAWIIIKKSADPVYAENGVRRDKMETLFMF
jgi:hypothetical protein